MQLKVPCPHCNKVTAIEDTKLPDKPVTFACPHCKGKVTADKSKLLAALGAEAASAASAAAAPAPAAETGSADLPPGASIPPGIVLAEDPAALEEVRGSLSPYGCTLEAMATAEEARGVILMDPPPLVIYIAGTVGSPPYEPLQPITSIPPNERRRIFLALIGEGLRTLDGNAAFMYQVNLCVNRRELGALASTLYSAIDYHHRLYRPYFSVIEAALR